MTTCPKGAAAVVAAITRVREAEAELPALSVTLTVNEEVPATVGVPLITPVAAANESPSGSEPELTLQLYGVVPPMACRVAEYAVCVWPSGKLVVVTCSWFGGAEFTVSVARSEERRVGNGCRCRGGG